VDTLDIVCFPDAEWDAVLWTNRQHMMSRLARRPGVRVLYVAPPRFVLARFLRRRRLRDHEFSRDRRAGLFTYKLDDRLWVLQPLLPLPNGFVRRRAGRLLDRWLARIVLKRVRRLGFERTVVWSYTPLVERILGRLRGQLVYDVVDDYASQPNYIRLGPGVVGNDRRLTEAADVVLTTSRTLQEQRSALNPNCHLVGNAADIDLFAQARNGGVSAASDLSSLSGPVLGFHGALSGYKLDLEVIRHLSRGTSGFQLVFVGPVFDEELSRALAQLPNVHLLGYRPPEELPRYLRRFDVCIVPYQRNSYTEHLSALKVRECLAAGRPVVATDLPGFREFDGMIAIADGPEAFERAVQHALEEPPAPISLADPALAEFTWDAKVDRALGLVKAAVAS
jgi:glycosyltransferase involved in cell wall biosynthesis